MTTREILDNYLEFYKLHGFKQIPNVSLVPEGDPTLLFVNSGMFPLVPYLSGEAHPLGKRLLNVQRSLRFEDIDDIGDNRHTMVFHMLGHWSLGDYSKKEQFEWLYDFLFNGLKLDPNRTFATVFEGDENAPRDVESINVLKEIYLKYGIEAKEYERIFLSDKKTNWWKRGDALGELGGPDSEVYYYFKEDGNWKGKSPVTNEDEFIEIGNSVFMQYKLTEKGWEPLPQSNIDFGGGLERIAMVVQKKQDIFETDSFWPIIEKAQEITGKGYSEGEDTKKYMRILADHMRAVVMLMMDGITPSNKDQGYALRRLLRKMFRVGRHLGVEKGLLFQLVPQVTEVLSWLYPELQKNEKNAQEIILSEEEKFAKVLKCGEKEAQKIIDDLNKSELGDSEEKNIKTIETACFNLYQSLGYPLELFFEDLKDRGINISYFNLQKKFEESFKSHQDQSRSGAEGKFKGGLADHSDVVVKYHTTTHLLQKALREVLGNDVRQLGSNITNERLRFDFPCGKKLSETEVKSVENRVNDYIKKGLPVNFIMMPKEEAEKNGALFIKNESYPDQVKVYYIGGSLEDSISREFCGGPHVTNTAEIKPIEIYKQDSIGEGKLRIYARFVE